MLKSGTLNPQINALLSRFRHTNTIVIADRRFPFWPHVKTIDISLTDDIPTVHDVLKSILPMVSVGKARKAEEFRRSNSQAINIALQSLTEGVTMLWEPHTEFKLRVPAAIGLIRTGDTTRYANIILESA